jgi:hypothetical protein
MIFFYSFYNKDNFHRFIESSTSIIYLPILIFNNILGNIIY